MKMKIPVRLRRCEFEKLEKCFVDSSTETVTFDLFSDVRSIHFDSDYHNLSCGTELESVTARVELK